jgi:hypothetical protein
VSRPPDAGDERRPWYTRPALWALVVVVLAEAIALALLGIIPR